MPACAVSGALGHPARCPGGNRQFLSQIKAPKLPRTESPHGCNSPNVPPHTCQPPAPPQPPRSHVSLVLHRPHAPRGTHVTPPPCTPPGASCPRWYPWRSLPHGQGRRSIPGTPTRAPSAPRLTAAPRCPGVERQWERAAGGRRGLSLPLEQHRERAGKREKKAEEGKEAGEEKKKIKKKERTNQQIPAPSAEPELSCLAGLWGHGRPCLPPQPPPPPLHAPKTRRGTPPNPAPAPKPNRLPPCRLAGGPKRQRHRGHGAFRAWERRRGPCRRGEPKNPVPGQREARLPWPALRNVLCLGCGFGRGAGSEASPPPWACRGGAPHPGVLSAGRVCPAPVAGASEGPKRIERGRGGCKGVVSNSLRTRHPPVNITRLQTC